MSQDQRGRSGSVDPNLAQRVESLVDEAVAQAAKGSYREAAARAEKALAIDPDNAAARDLFDSYRRIAADDDDRRRQRRSIAAAAAAIEEMIEAGRLEEAGTATQALALQYGHEAPVEELNGRIAAARGEDLDFAELDAAIHAIRQPATATARSAAPAARLDAVGVLSAEIEDHLRSGRLDEASGRLGSLAILPGSEERLRKLQSRIEEARHVAEEHRREEEILIATAAIEERIRRGALDDAAERLAALDARHGSSAPVAELRQQIEEARAGAALETAAAHPAVGERTGELLGLDDDSGSTTMVFSGWDAPAPGRGRWIALAIAVALVAGGGGWWLYQRSSTGATVTAPAGDPIVIADPDGAPSATALDSEAAAADPLQTGDAIAADKPAAAAAEAARDAAAAAPLASPPRSAEAATGSVAAPITDRPRERAPVVPATDAAREPVPPADSSRPSEPTAAEVNDPPAEAPASSSPPPVVATDAGDPARAPEVVVQAQPVAVAPPPPAPAEAAPQPAVEESKGAEIETAPASDARNVEPDAAPAQTERAAVAEEASRAPSDAAPAAAAPSGPLVLGCGAAGVVCVKTVAIPTPVYPAPARARRLTGNVVVMALVDERGRVIETRVDSGSFRFFNDSAVEAAKRAVFQPATLRGVPGRSWVRLTFKFDPR